MPQIEILIFYQFFYALCFVTMVVVYEPISDNAIPEYQKIFICKTGIKVCDIGNLLTGVLAY